MKRVGLSLLIVTALVVSLISASSVMAQQTRISPHESIWTVVEGNRVSLIYGRPYTKDPKSGEMRKIWGGLVPYDKVWRLGADLATLFLAQRPIVIGGTELPAGAYTLFMLPVENGTSKLIINKQVGQWGLQYDEKQDFARVDLTREAIAAPVDQFTMAIAANPAGGGVLKLMWEKTQFSVPFTVVPVKK